MVKVAAKEAVPDAEAPFVRLPAVPTTGAVPSVVPAELKVIVPVGPAPELAVATVPDRVMREFAEALGMGVMDTVVPALVTEIASAADVLEV